MTKDQEIIRAKAGLLELANPFARFAPATPAMTDDSILPFSFPAVSRKKITADFDGGRLTSDGGAMLLATEDLRLPDAGLRHPPAGQT